MSIQGVVVKRLMAQPLALTWLPITLMPSCSFLAMSNLPQDDTVESHCYVLIPKAGGSRAYKYNKHKYVSFIFRP